MNTRRIFRAVFHAYPGKGVGDIFTIFKPTNKLIKCTANKQQYLRENKLRRILILQKLMSKASNRKNYANSCGEFIFLP